MAELPDAQRDAWLPTVDVQLDETCSLQLAGSRLEGRLAVVRDVATCAAVTVPSGITAAGLLLGSLQHHELSKPFTSDSGIPVWFIDPTAAFDVLASKGRLKITTLRLPLDAKIPANAQRIPLKASASVLPGNKLTIHGTSKHLIRLMDPWRVQVQETQSCRAYSSLSSELARFSSSRT